MRKKLTAQFWIGNSDSEDRFFGFVGEDKNYWSEENEDGDKIPLSQFIATQGQTWYDHDFFEAGYSEKAGSVLEKFGQHSYADKWASLIEGEMANHNISSINAFIMIGVYEPLNQPAYRQVRNPRSCQEEGIDLVYVGELTHDNYDY